MANMRPALSGGVVRKKEIIAHPAQIPRNSRAAE
jgi:hypothetical protein